MSNEYFKWLDMRFLYGKIQIQNKGIRTCIHTVSEKGAEK